MSSGKAIRPSVVRLRRGELASRIRCLLAGAVRVSLLPGIWLCELKPCVDGFAVQSPGLTITHCLPTPCILHGALGSL